MLIIIVLDKLLLVGGYESFFFKYVEQFPKGHSTSHEKLEFLFSFSFSLLLMSGSRETCSKREIVISLRVICNSVRKYRIFFKVH